ncbi:MAG: phosphoglycerate dehydrogenase [Deltaproteobacteria bacterium]|nr:phosphoglycerate dehydrogenase [Deltaproteobacteria bacterium]MBW2070279.1 phosphoglycerate dehydrogenase [Deltaproteobacteria bacterium]
MKILISDSIAATGVDLLRSVPDFEVAFQPDLSPQELKEAIADADALIIRSATKVTADLIEAAPRLRVIGRAGIGLDNVDIMAASRRGIVVMNNPEGNIITTAEHTIAMLMALSRNIYLATNSMKAGKWDKKKFTGIEVYHKTLGIIGIGRIGRIVADRAIGLAMNVIAYDPHLEPESIARLGVEPVSLEELFARSDYITVHTPLTRQTRGLLDRTAFSKMKDGVMIINCARGHIVNEKDLYDAIVSGKVAGAALDVYEKEPPGDNPLLKLDQVICTPHLGASTGEAQENVAVGIAQQIKEFLLTGAIRNAVNVPQLTCELLSNICHYLTLAERLGSFLGQVTQGAMQEVTIEYKGTVAELDTAPITLAVLKGLLEPILQHEVNYVNAPVLAKERGIVVKDTTSKDAEDYLNLITVRVKTTAEETQVSGTLFGKKEPRLVRFNTTRLEADIHGNLVLIYNRDVPGTFGSIGTCMGKHNINISMWKAGQIIETGENVLLLRVDSPVEEKAMEDLIELPNVNSVQLLSIN